MHVSMSRYMFACKDRCTYPGMCIYTSCTIVKNYVNNMTDMLNLLAMFGIWGAFALLFLEIRHSTKARQTATCSETKGTADQVKSYSYGWCSLGCCFCSLFPKFQQISSVPSRYLHLFAGYNDSILQMWLRCCLFPKNWHECDLSILWFTGFWLQKNV